jgi:peptidoglycan/xylan/chitin deacetylase (PgdA/CDA1 family)
MQPLSSFDLPGGVILMYHRVGESSPDPWSLCVSPRHFGEHLDVLRRFTRPMRLVDLVRRLDAGGVPAGATVVTFDDGYAASLLIARTLLERHDVPATLFLTSGHVGRRLEFWWDELERIFLEPGVLPDKLELSVPGLTGQWSLDETCEYSHQEAFDHRGWRMPAPPPTARHYLYRQLWERIRALSNEERIAVMDALSEWAGAERTARASHRSLLSEEAEELTAHELLEVGAHGVTHQILSSLTLEEQHMEICSSKEAVESITGHPVLSFSYPYGAYTEKTRDLVSCAGFSCACSTRPGAVSNESDAFALPRLHVEDWSGEEFAARLAACVRS